MRWVLPMVLLALLATAAAGLAVRQLYAEPEPAALPAVVPNEIPASQQPGSGTVEATKEATAHPLFENVRPLLQTYFDAINAKRYDRWRTVVTDKRASNEPEIKWRRDYESTQDGSIAIWRIETGPSGTARVLLSFTSVQELRHAPPELPERCIRWWVIFPLSQDDGAWKLDSGVTTAAPQHLKC